MRVVYPSKVENTRVVNDFEKKYGKGINARINFAFQLIPIFFFTMTIIVSGIVGFGLITNIDVSSYLAVIVPVFTAPLTFMLGYLYGKPVEKD